MYVHVHTCVRVCTHTHTHTHTRLLPKHLPILLGKLVGETCLVLPHCCCALVTLRFICLTLPSSIQVSSHLSAAQNLIPLRVSTKVLTPTGMLPCRESLFRQRMRQACWGMGHCVLADGKRKRRYPGAPHPSPTTQAGGHSDGGGDAPRLFIKAILS